MAKKRDYKAEYRRRVARGLARGLSRSQARGHPRPSEKPIEAPSATPDPKLEAAILKLNRGSSLTAAARSEHIAVERLRRFMVTEELATKDGRRWVPKDRRPRRVPVITRGGISVRTVDGYQQARLVGKHHHAVGQFVRTNNPSLIEPFEGLVVRGANGRKHPLETDPNTLHRIAAMESPEFHEIYEIVSPTN